MLESIVKVFKELGLPTGLLLLFCLALWSSATWVGANVVVPITASQTKLIDAQATLINELRSSEARRSSSLESIALNQDRISKNQERLAEAQQSILGLINDRAGK